MAHALAHQPLQLFEANIFYPEPATFAYSDAMLLPAAALAPLFWLGVPAVAIYNFALLGALTLSGFCDVSAGANADRQHDRRDRRWNRLRLRALPYRAASISKWRQCSGSRSQRWRSIVCWRDQRLGDGVLFGLFVAAQFLSGIYGRSASPRRLSSWRRCSGSRPGAPAQDAWSPRSRFSVVIAGALILPLRVGVTDASRMSPARAGLQEIQHYQATAANYLAAPPSNRLYGWTSERYGGEELNLFPGIIAVALGLLGLICSRGRVVYVYAALPGRRVRRGQGFDGWTYPVLYAYLRPFQG